MEHDAELSGNAVGADGLFLRAADRKRFDYVMHAVCTEGQSLALSSTNDGVLDHYGRLVINRLRQTPDVLIEVFLPANTEALLDRFNQILAGLSLTDARKASGAHAPRRIMVAHDAKAINPRDLQLLARLMNDFPGANTSLVLFLDQSREHQHEKVLESFGQRLLRWPVDVPTRSEGEALLKVGAMLGFGIEVKKLLAATGVVDGPPPKESLFTLQLAAARKAGRTEPVLEDEQAPTAPSSTDGKKSLTSSSAARHRSGGRTMLRALGSALRWSVGALLLLTVSLVVITALFPARISPLLTTSPLARHYLPPWVVSAVTGMTGGPAPVSKVAETLATAPTPIPEPEPDTKPEAGAEAAEAAETTPAEPLAPQGKPDAAPTVPAATADSQQRASAADKVEPVAKVDPVAPLAPVVKAAPKVIASANALAPRSESGVDQQVRRAIAGSYFVQHVSLGSMAEAQEWRAQYPALGKSRIAAVATQSQGVKFAVVSGPFASRKDAEVFVARPGVPADPWLRPGASLQKALLPGAR